MKHEAFDPDEELLIDCSYNERSLNRQLQILRAERRYHAACKGVCIAVLALEFVLLLASQLQVGGVAGAGFGFAFLLAFHHSGQARSVLRQVQALRLMQFERAAA